MMHKKTRAYIYGIALAVAPLAIAYGWISEDTAPLWVALLGSILVPTLALGNLKDDKDGPKHRE